MIRARMEPGFRARHGLVLLFLAACLGLAAFAAGMERPSPSPADQALALEALRQERLDQLFRYCLNGNRIEVTRPGCRPLAVFITTQADAAEAAEADWRQP